MFAIALHGVGGHGDDGCMAPGGEFGLADAETERFLKDPKANPGTEGDRTPKQIASKCSSLTS